MNTFNVISILICILLIGIALGSVIAKPALIKNDSAEPAMPTTLLVFKYPFEDPEFLQYGEIIVCYEYVAPSRHLIAASNNGHEYIMPLFDDRDTAIEFMNYYFDYLMAAEK